MKAGINIIKKVIIAILLLASIGGIAIYWYLTTEWKKYYTKEEIKSFAVMINNSPKLSTNFYNIYDHLKSGRKQSHTSICLSALFNLIIGNKKSVGQSSFIKAAYHFPKKNGMRDYADFKLSWGLEKYTTADKCFDFAMKKENEELLLRLPNQDINSITNLKDTIEILKYLALSKAPSLYSNNPDKLNMAITNLRIELNNK